MHASTYQLTKFEVPRPNLHRF